MPALLLAVLFASSAALQQAPSRGKVARTSRRAVVGARGGDDVATNTRPVEAVLQPLSFLFVLSVAVVALAPAPHLIQKLGAQRATSLLATASSVSALCEIACAPLVGALADSYGRKPVVLGVLALVLASNVLTAVSPSTGAILVSKAVGSAAVGLYFLATSAMLGDVYNRQPAKLAGVTGVLGALVNVGFASGVKLSGCLPRGDLRVLYSAATAASVVALATATVCVRETAPELLPFRPRAFDPFSSRRLFQSGHEMRLLAILLCLTLQPVFMGDTFQIFMLEQWKLSGAQVATLYTVLSACGAAGNAVSGRCVRLLGIQLFTAVATLSNAGFWVACTVSHRAALVAGAVGFLGPARTLGCSTSITSLGARRGIPQGQLSGDRANLIAILKVIGPLLYGKLYVEGFKNGVAIAPFLLNIALTLTALCVAPFALSAGQRAVAPR